MSDEVNPFSRHQPSGSGSSSDGRPGDRMPDGTVQHVPVPKKRGPWIWLIPLLLLLIVCPVVCCGGIAMFGWNMMSVPIDAAVEALNNDQRVTSRLGSPVTSSAGMNVSQFNIENNNGQAEVSFNAIGPDQSASVSGEMQMIAGVWSPKDLTVTFTDGSSIQLPAAQ